MPSIPLPTEIPFSVQELREEFDRMLDRVWHGGLSTAPLDGQDWAPRLDVYEHPDHYQVRVEIPGLTADDVEVSILDNVLTVKGTKAKADQSSEDVRRLRSECRFGSFCRRFELPSPAEEASVSATCKHGVLEITISRAATVKGRSVKVESAD